MVENAMSKKPSDPPIYRKCYVRPSAANSESDQLVMIEASGSTSGKHARLYKETGKKGATPELDRLLKTSRAGEEFVCSELQCLGDDMPAVMAVLQRVQDKGLIVVEAATGRRFSGAFDGPAAGMTLYDYFRRHSLSKAKARRAGKEGAKARWEGLAGRPPLREAVRRWNRAVDDGATKEEAIAAVNEGYSTPWSYDHFLRMARNGELPGAIKRLRAGARRKT